MSEIKVLHNIPDNRFEVDLGKKQAILIYMIKANLLILLHSEVPPEFEGKGIAGKITRVALDYAKQEGYKVRSYCSYSARYLERHPEYADLLG